MLLLPPMASDDFFAKPEGDAADLLSPTFEAAVDQELYLLSRWIPIAADALMSFYMPGKGWWLQRYQGTSSVERDQDEYQIAKDGLTIDNASGIAKEEQGHTSTLRAFFAMHEYHRWLLEEDGSAPLDNITETATVACLREVITGYIQDRTNSGISEEDKLFRDSHYLIAVSVISNISTQIANETDRKHIEHLAQAIVAGASDIAVNCAMRMTNWEGGRALPTDQIHDFITLHGLRGVDAYWYTTRIDTDRTSSINARFTDGLLHTLDQILYDRVRKYVPRILGYYTAGVSSRFDPIELAFSVALLNRLSIIDQTGLTRSAIEAIVSSQLDDGAWPQGRLLSYEERGHPHVPSYEVALSLVQVLAQQVRQGDLRLCAPILFALRKSFNHVRENFAVVDDYSGWANDHTRLPKFLESWASAVVLTFLIHYRDLLLEIQQRLILRRYIVKSPKQNVAQLSGRLRGSGEFAWADLLPAFRIREGQDETALDGYWESNSNEPIRDAVRALITGPVGTDLVGRPALGHRALILWGDPGTGKTSLIEAIAATLRWPLLILSPPDFLRRGGLEGFEASSDQIFNHLLRLRRVAVLFDECEDFFKARRNFTELESRTLGAFITAGMLPRLQNLRQNRWVIHALAMNGPLTSLDSAVRRPGRFDASIHVAYPDIASQERFIKERAPESMREALNVALHEYESQRVKQASPSVTFAILGLLVNDLPEDTSPMKAFTRLQRLVHQDFPPPLVLHPEPS